MLQPQSMIASLSDATSDEDIEHRDKLVVQLIDRLMNYSTLLRNNEKTTEASTMLTKALGLLGRCENIEAETHVALINVSVISVLVT